LVGTRRGVEAPRLAVCREPIHTRARPFDLILELPGPPTLAVMLGSPERLV
jgi:hypothetical protein